jgi:hypothetical protein
MPSLRVDLEALAAAHGVDLAPALVALRALYAEVDERNHRNTAALDLPCKSGCSSCCEESVLLTRLEFYGVWDHVQRHADDETIARIVDEGLALYQRHRAVIEALERPPPAGFVDHSHLLLDVKFRCPILDETGACRAYPMREIKGRLFGCSFNDENGIYGCHLVGAHLSAHLGDRPVTLVRARPMASRVHLLPLGKEQQLYPFYIHELYGAERPPTSAQQPP